MSIKIFDEMEVSFIQAYLGEFDTYIFDEPTSGVDIESARVMIKYLIKLKKQGKAVLLTSHNLDEVQEFSDYIFLLKHGEIVKHGTVEDIISKKDEQGYKLRLDVTNLENSLDKYFNKEEYIINGSEITLFSQYIIKLNNIMLEVIQAGGLVIDFEKEQQKLKDVIFTNE